MNNIIYKAGDCIEEFLTQSERMRFYTEISNLIDEYEELYYLGERGREESANEVLEKKDLICRKFGLIYSGSKRDKLKNR